MADHSQHTVVLVDVPTAATLAQVLPVLLLTLAVELRRTKIHREISRGWLAAFVLGFGVIETVLVLSIDGALYPFQWFDACSALTIFTVLAVLFRLSLVDPHEPPEKR